MVDVLHFESNPVSIKHVVGAEDRAYIALGEQSCFEGPLTYQSNQNPTVCVTSNSLVGEESLRILGSCCRTQRSIETQSASRRSRPKCKCDTRTSYNVERVSHVNTEHSHIARLTNSSTYRRLYANVTSTHTAVKVGVMEVYSCFADCSASLVDSSAAILSARGVSYLPMTTSTNCIFPALANWGSSKSFSSPDLSRTVYDLVKVPSRSPRVVRSDVHFLVSCQPRDIMRKK